VDDAAFTATSFNTLTLVGNGAVQSVAIAKALTISSPGGTQVSTSLGTISADTFGASADTKAVTLKANTGGILTINAGTQSASIGPKGTVAATGGTVILTGISWVNSTLAAITQTSGTLSIGDGSNLTSITSGILTGTISANAATLSGMSNTGTLSAIGAATWVGGTNSRIIRSTAGTFSFTGTIANTGTLSGALISAATISAGTISGGTISGALTIGSVALLGTNVGNGTTVVTGASNTNNGLKFTAGSSLAINAGGSLMIAGNR
jgi:hypothetical protein